MLRGPGTRLEFGVPGREEGGRVEGGRIDGARADGGREASIIERVEFRPIGSRR